ncbi:exosporium leader peptide, partial [Priestia aryabhattai]|uniref:C1q-like domain-containing protein n=1 Tax=Priestia aryabhattai TaxID=412384 RepID=UPI001EBB5128|nr:exosporium leader peptide [Priestia aryabhattai]MBY0105251.1 exosporium leader peptide [Priestia aryabhattai]
NTGATGNTGANAPSINFLAQKSINQTYTTPTIVRISYETIMVNNGGGYSIATNIFTAPVTGFYLFTAGVGFSSSSGGPQVNARLSIRVNGVPFVSSTEFDNTVIGTSTFNVATAVPLVAGSQVDVSFNSVQNGNLVIGQTSFFSGSLLSV